MTQHISSSRFFKEAGFALPMVLVFLLILSIISVGLIIRHSGIGAKEFVHSKSLNTRIGGAHAGVELGKYLTQYGKVKYTPGYKQTYILDMNGEKVTVTVEATTMSH